MSVKIWIAATAFTALATACSSGAGAGKTASAGASKPPASTQSAAQSSSGPAVLIKLANDRLTAPNGHTLYYNTVDTAAKIDCVRACATEWPPLTGKPQPGTGLDASDLATTARPDGSTQITYYGHPLYAFSGDAAAGTAKGEGIADQGGKWLAATPQQAQRGGASSSAKPSVAPSSSTAGGGYSYP